MIQAIFFDLDDTLLDFGKAERVAVVKAFRQVGLTPDEAFLREYSEINQAQWRRMERGETTREALLVDRFNILFRRHGIAVPGSVCEDYYRQYLAIGHYFIDGAEALLAALAPKYPLYLASNGVAATQYSRLKSAGIGHYFQKIFISEDTGYHKPEKEYFQYCFRAMGDPDPSTLLMVGDSLSSDILGGKNAGMQTCWFNPQHLTCPMDCKPDFEVHHLLEILNIL